MIRNILLLPSYFLLVFSTNLYANDDCMNAIILAEDTTLTWNSNGSTGTDITSCAVGDTRSLWYEFTAVSYTHLRAHET